MKIHVRQFYVQQGLGWESSCETVICGAALHQITINHCVTGAFPTKSSLCVRFSSMHLDMSALYIKKFRCLNLQAASWRFLALFRWCEHQKCHKDSKQM
jgi:hypothetical protein